MMQKVKRLLEIQEISEQEERRGGLGRPDAAVSARLTAFSRAQYEQRAAVIDRIQHRANCLSEEAREANDAFIAYLR